MIPDNSTSDSQVLIITKKEAKALWSVLSREWLSPDNDGKIVRQILRRCYELANDGEKGKWMSSKEATTQETK